MAKGIKTGGRQKGAMNKRNLEYIAEANKAFKDGEIMPREICLLTCRALWKEAVAVDAKGEVIIDTDKAREASAVASVLLPYYYPKLNSIEAKPPEQPLNTDDDNVIEHARRLAFTLTMGARELAKQSTQKKIPVKT